MAEQFGSDHLFHFVIVLNCFSLGLVLSAPIVRASLHCRLKKGFYTAVVFTALEVALPIKFWSVLLTPSDSVWLESWVRLVVMLQF